MEKILEALCDEIVERVLRKLEDNASNMLNTIKYKVKGENIEELSVDHIPDFENEVERIATEMAEKVIDNASFDVRVNV